MRTAPFEFRREGRTLRGLLRLPDGASFPTRLPVIVQGPGWLGLADAAHYARYHEALVGRGFAVVVFDYGGFGRSDGEPGWLVPSEQIRDIQAAIWAVSGRALLDEGRVGLFGMGGTGAGNAIMAAARTPNVRCVVAYHVVADGADWLRRMRTAREWEAFLAQVAADRARRDRGEPGEMVDPRHDLMVESTERRASGLKRAVDAKLPARFHLASAEDLLAYRPIDEVGHVARYQVLRAIRDAAGEDRLVEERERPRILPMLIVTVAGDTVTPEDHAVAVFERASGPKRLVRVRGVGHYEADDRCFRALAREVTDWFERWLAPAPGWTPSAPAAFAEPEGSEEAEVVEIDAARVPA